jgi:peptide deformylase
MEVVVYPDPRLLKKTAPITNVTDEVRANAAEMLRLMYEDRGVGLAAPQVGWSARIFVMNPTSDASKPEEETVLLNPKLVKKTGRVKGEEGCLSFPGIYAEVRRPDRCRVRAQGVDGKTFEAEYEGFVSRILQHEYDHLEGVLLVDRMSPADKQRHKAALQELVDRFKSARSVR